MLTQVYEISTIEEAASISAIGVDHVGVLVGDGRFPRELPIKAASDIGAAINPQSRRRFCFSGYAAVPVGAQLRGDLGKPAPHISSLGVVAVATQGADRSQLAALTLRQVR